MKYLKNNLLAAITFSFLAIFAVSIFVSPLSAFAQGEGGPSAASFDFHIDNPVGGFDNLVDLLVELLKIVMLIIGPIIAVMLIYTGYLFVTARGNETQLKNAKQMFLYVVIGAAIILGAEIIARAIQATVNGLT
ncbi:MAG TPA: TrbC/VirB2 family protein [Candidatus Paceibacterota bacterium]|nr:TrbC/VirB2 family protein [Candidatus Paceibacterota bacterium]